MTHTFDQMMGRAKKNWPVGMFANIEAAILWRIAPAPLHAAIEKGRLDLVKIILDKGANLETLFDGRTPLHYAIQRGQTDIAITLIQNGANKESIYYHMTPLQHAIRRGHTDIANALNQDTANHSAHDLVKSAAKVAAKRDPAKALVFSKTSKNGHGYNLRSSKHKTDIAKQKHPYHLRPRIKPTGRSAPAT